MMDTSANRKAIFARIRAQSGHDKRTEQDRDTAKAQALAYLAQPQAGPQPALPADLVEHFCRQARKMADTVEVLSSVEQVPTALRRYLQEQGLPLSAVIWPEWEHLDWAEVGLKAEVRAVTDADAVGVTGVFCAVAETGSLLLLSGPKNQVACALLPETHVAILSATKIVAYMEQAFALLKQEQIQVHGDMPRTATFISGPSRTGDIEQTIVLGAHGPYRVHVLLIP